MYTYNYILLAGFICLLFNKNTRFAAFVFLAGWALYLLLTIGASASFYYVASATIEVSIAYILNTKYRAVSYLGYSLILVNMYGLFLYKNGIGPISYDAAYALISITQFMFLLARAILNGIRLPTKHFMVRAVNFDSRGAYGIMYKNTATKGSNQ